MSKENKTKDKADKIIQIVHVGGMDYELCKKLKDAGFPQPIIDKSSADDDFLCYVPTLSELIEACGDRFHGLWRMMDNWYTKSDIGQEVKSSTPEEAVALLWLELN